MDIFVLQGGCIAIAVDNRADQDKQGCGDGNEMYEWRWYCVSSDFLAAVWKVIP